jgi:MinD superfamily P-loop ATPase
MILVVASGKGGTGKTTVAVNLALVAGIPIRLLDTDVEEPNVHLFLPEREAQTTEVTVPVPEVDESLCDACGACSALCRYHAIVSLKTKPLLFPELCHSCGGCALVCPRGAICEVPRRIGDIIRYHYANIEIVQGRLDVGNVMAPPLIRAVIAQAATDLPVIIDAPPGTACSFVTATRPADLVLLVAEPTAFGLHDLSLSVEVLREVGKPFAVVVNRAGSGDDRVWEYCAREGIPQWGEIPDDRRIAEAYSRGEAIVDALPEYRETFHTLWERFSAECSDREDA